MKKTRNPLSLAGLLAVLALYGFVVGSAIKDNYWMAVPIMALGVAMSAPLILRGEGWSVAFKRPPKNGPAAPIEGPDPKEGSSGAGVRTTRYKVELDATGKVLRIEVPEIPWTLKQSGKNRYYNQAVGSLLHAAETLKKIGHIPELTYYTVDTPDGPLGRDTLGFYTEGPIKTKNLALETEFVHSDPVECSSLTCYGDIMKSGTTVAQLRKSGQYAQLVLLMKCGRCGYESPVETQAGSSVRQCYCCGTANKCQRGEINVFLGSSMVKV
jgi:hypothetical protein